MQRVAAAVLACHLHGSALGVARVFNQGTVIRLQRAEVLAKWGALALSAAAGWVDVFCSMVAGADAKHVQGLK